MSYCTQENDLSNPAHNHIKFLSFIIIFVFSCMFIEQQANCNWPWSWLW